MAEDVYFMDGEEFFCRKGGNKIEPLEGFHVLLPNGKKKHPLLILKLGELEMTSDGKEVLFYAPDGRVYTTRTLRKDHTFLPPKVPDRCVVQPIIGSVHNVKKDARKRKKRPR